MEKKVIWKPGCTCGKFPLLMRYGPKKCTKDAITLERMIITLEKMMEGVHFRIYFWSAAILWLLKKNSYQL